MLNEFPVSLPQKGRERALACASQSYLSLYKARQATHTPSATYRPFVDDLVWLNSITPEYAMQDKGGTYRPSTWTLRQAILRSLAIGLMVVLLALGLTSIAYAQEPPPLFVTKCTDGFGDAIELATAINLANSDADADTIIMPLNCTYLISTLQGNDGQTALPTITQPLTIIGNNSILRRHTGAKLRFLRASANLTLHDLIFENGDIHTIDDGGAIFAEAGTVLTLNNVFFDSNHANSGGAVFALGDLVITGGEYLDNQARQDVGGAIYVEGNLTIDQVTFLGNDAVGNGGAIYVAGGNATIRDATISFNRTQNSGGAMMGVGDGVLEIINSTVHGNKATGSGGAIQAEMAAIIRDTQFSRNEAALSGGAILHTKSLSVHRSKFEENRSEVAMGGAISSGHALTVENSLFIGNHATLFDSSLYIEKTAGTSRIVNSLWIDNGLPESEHNAIYVRNTGAGEVIILHNVFAQRGPTGKRAITVEGGVVTVRNNIIDNHATGLVAIGGTVRSDHNLYHANVEDESGAINSTSNFTGQEPRFVDPVNFDYRLQPDSFAVDKAAPSDSLVDSRGIWRNGEGIIPDIGAFEVEHGIVPASAILTLNKCPKGVGNVAELVNAVKQANAQPGVNRLILPAGCLYTLVEPQETSPIDPMSGLDIIRDPLEIIGNGATIRRSSESSESFRLLTVLDASLWLRDLTLENGDAFYGGAIAFSRLHVAAQHLEIENVTFRNNVGEIAAGALLVGNAEAIITESHFENNRTPGEPGIGGAVVIASSKANIHRSTFIDNSAAGFGGAIAVDDSPIGLDNNTFERNGANVGGGIYMARNPEESVWTNNVWSNNRAFGFQEGFAIKAAAIYITQSGPLTVLHNTFVHSLSTDAAAIVADNQPENTELLVRNSIFVNYGNSISSRHPLTNPVFAQQNLFHNSPLIGEGFVDDPRFVDANNGDYRLQPTSRAVDNGMDARVLVDRDMRPRPFNGRFDIGAYEYVESSQPDEPDDPEQPGDPDNPGNPGDPDNPDGPDDPTEPDEPDDPQNPTDPEEPEQPDGPENPDGPGNPDAPDNPVVPSSRILMPLLGR